MDYLYCSSCIGGDHIKLSIMRLIFFILLSFVIGILFGSLSSSALHDKNEEVVQNCIRLKCLHALVEDYSRQTGHPPKDLAELKKWCDQDTLKKKMFGRASKVYSDSVSSIDWIMLPGDSAGVAPGFTSGLQSSLRFEISMDSMGDISLKKNL